MTTSQVETWYAIRHGPLYHLSEQQLVDCDREWNMGCNGGWPTDAFNYLRDNGAILRDDYPYIDGEQSCRANQHDKIYYLADPAYVDVQANNLGAFKAALRLGPVSVAFGASDAFMVYDSGIYDGDCTADVNHGMTAVGFGVDNGTEYVLIRNSWGTWWGESGYVRVILDQVQNGGKCEVYSWPSYPITE